MAELMIGVSIKFRCVISEEILELMENLSLILCELLDVLLS
jgi:hypothetical protein